METKTQKAVKLISSGDWKSGLQLIKTFRLDFTREQKRLIEIASDILNGHGKFYRDIGVDIDKTVCKCKKMLLEKYKI